MATGPLGRQPDKLDYLSPTQFRFGINQLLKVEFFTVAANIPGINMGEAIFPTPFKDIPIMGDKQTYENLEITFFIIDEFLENYRSLHEWMTAIGFRKAENSLVILDQTSQTLLVKRSTHRLQRELEEPHQRTLCSLMLT